MIKTVSARLLGGILCAASILAWPATGSANGDEPPTLTEDVSDQEIMPPGGGDERVSDSYDASNDARPTDDAPEASVDSSASSPREPDRVEPVDHEAAKRALLSDPKPENKPNPLLDGRGPDYYDRRAKELLKEDSDKGAVALHPLMEAHPDSYVVVCTGGCPSGKSAQVVSLLPKRSVAPAPSPAPQPAGLEISCVAGCGANGASSFASTPASGNGPAVAATVGEWMTTVATAPASAAPPAPKPVGSGDWMERINRERAEAKAAADKGATAKSNIAAAAQINEAKAPAAPVSQDAKPAVPAAVAPAKAAQPASDSQAKPAVADVKPTVPVEAKPAAAPEAKPVAAVAKDPAPDAKAAPEVAPTKPAVAAEAKPAAPIETKPAATPEAKSAAAVAKDPVPEAKPAPAVVPAKPAAVAEVKPAAPVETKPAAAAEAKPVVAIETKPAPAAPEAKPAVAAQPAPVVAAETKPAPPAETVTAKPVEPKTVAVAEVKPTTPPAEPAPAARQMAALDPSKMPSAAAPEKSATAQDKPSPAPAPTASPATVSDKPAAASEDKTKVAALEPPAADKPAPAVPAVSKDRVISVLSEDKDMNAAIETARKAIDTFWKSYEAPGPGETDHALKVAVAGNGTTEHFWLTRIKRENGKLSGVISNQPQSVKSVKMGQRYEFTADMISDWTFKRNGKLVGNETMRVLLPRMPQEQAAVYRQMYETP